MLGRAFLLSKTLEVFSVRYTALIIKHQVMDNTPMRFRMRVFNPSDNKNVRLFEIAHQLNDKNQAGAHLFQ